MSQEIQAGNFSTSKVFVQVYDTNEVSATYVNENGESNELFIRMRIGMNDGNQLVMLENGKFYMIEGWQSIIYETSEFSIKKLNKVENDIRLVKAFIGDVSKLTTIYKNLVGALNEISLANSSPRRIEGFIKYLSDGLFPVEPKDLEIRYNHLRKRFEYYSDIGEWIVLPQSWQRLGNIVRKREELPKELKEPEVYGVLEENKVLMYLDKQWTEINLEKDKPGDEYLVQQVFNTQFNGNANGSVIYTPKGWTYLVNYNN